MAQNPEEKKRKKKEELHFNKGVVKALVYFMFWGRGWVPLPVVLNNYS